MSSPRRQHFWRSPRRLICRLRLAVSALALGLTLGLPNAFALDLDDTEGLSNDTVAKRDRLRFWDNSKKYGAEAVGDRDRPYVEPEGIRLGNYVAFPSVGALVIFDDNILGHDIEKRSDIRTELTAKTQLSSQFSRHALDLSLDGKIVSYMDNSDQDYANVRAKIDGALQFDHANTLAVDLLSALEHEERTDPSYPLRARGPVEVFHNRATTGITHDVSRLYGTISATAESWNYTNTAAIDGSTLNEEARDTTIYSSQLRSGYRFSPGFEFVSKFKALKIENRGDAKIDRDAWGFEALAGLVFESNPLLRWRILGGYGVRDFQQANLTDVSALLLQAEVQWLPTQRLSIYGTVARQFLDTTDITSSGATQSKLKIRAEYDVYHNIVLNGAIEFRHDDFGGIERIDDSMIASVGVDYFLSKNWLFTFGYEHQIRDSTSDSQDMHRNRFMLGAKLRF